MATTPFVLQDTQKVSYTLDFVDADGNAAAVPAGDTILVASSDTGSATIAPDSPAAAGHAASGFIVGGTKLGTIQITGTAVGADGTTPDPNIAPAALSLQLVAGAATAAAFALGTPVSQ